MADSSGTREHDFIGGGSAGANGAKSTLPSAKPVKSVQGSGKTVLVGLLGGIASAVAFTIYQRLPDEQRDRVHAQLRSIIAARLHEFRDGLNL